MLKYECVVADIAQKIDNGVYPAHSLLPKTSDLCTQYGVSKITVKKAMDELESLGMITRRRGAGTFVKNAASGVSRHLGWQAAGRFLGTKTQYAETGIEITSRIHEFSVIEPSEEVAAALGMSEGFVYRIIRTRCIDEKPICIEYTYMPIALIPNLTVDVLTDSIYRFIKDDLGLTIDSAHSTIRATLPTPDECAWMHIESNHPLLEVEQTAFLADGTIFEYSITRHTKTDGEIRTVRHHRFETM